MKGLKIIGTQLVMLAVVFSCLINLSIAQDTAPENLPAPPPLPEGLAESAPPELPPDLPDSRELLDQLRQLDDLLALDKERLVKLRETIELIERMSPEEREAMRIRLSQITRMTPELRSEIQKLQSLIPDATRGSLSQFWLSLSEEHRDGYRREMEQLPRAQRGPWLKAKVTAFEKYRDQIFEEMRRQMSKPE
jgi:hypothetical protein